MSDSFYEGDCDDFDNSAFLNELDAIEAASQRPSTKPSDLPVNVPVPNQSTRPRFKPAPRKVASSSYYDEPFDVDAEELEKLDAFIAGSYAVKAQQKPQPQPVAGPSRTRQTTFDGRTLSPPSAKESHPKRVFERTKSSGPKEPKVKTWDRTTFSETGFRSTKQKELKEKNKEKGKGKDPAHNDGFDENFDDEEMEFEQFPSPHVEIGPPPPMRLKSDLIAAKDWIFPLNRPRRDYQFNIAKKCLFENTLVALPTGLGKTFIAGVVMLNYYRWFPDGKIVFVAPTKPLVAQQISACHEVCGIPGRDACLLTGEVQKSKRSSLLAHKRVIYMTPQTLVNDLVSRIIDPLDIILIVIDEAHRGSGDYAYCQIVRYMMAKNPHFRILALTATPGNNPEAVQKIVDSLHISHIEIRNESSFDLQKYLFKKETKVRVIKMDEHILKIQLLLIKIMNPLLDRLRKESIVFARNAVTLHPYSCMKGYEVVRSGKAGKGAWMWAYLKVLHTLARAMGNLMESSASSCYRCLKELKEYLVGSEKGEEKHVHLLKNPDFIKLMEECERQQAAGFAPHPKMKALVEIIMDHFNNPPSEPDTPAVEGTSDTSQSSSSRVMIFVGLREVIDEVVDVLDQYKPMLRAARFVGQGVDKKGRKGLAQAKQLETIQRFKKGEFNILVSTSVGEEGLDIGEIDRIICYDSSKSSIQMLQRVGRTGRKRTGYVDVLLSEDREERNWDKSNENYADVQQTIISGNQLEFYTDAERLLPDNIQPSCLQITMPIENYEPLMKESPKPVKGPVEKKKKRNKDINRNVPLGAFTGFVQASKLRPKTCKAKKPKKLTEPRDSDLEDDTDDEEITNGLRGLTSALKKGKSKTTKTGSNKGGQLSLLDLLKAPVVSRLDDDSDSDSDAGIGGSPTLRKHGRRKRPKSSESGDSPISPARPRKHRRQLLASSSSSSSDSGTGSIHAVAKRISQPSSSGATLASSRVESDQRNVGWLLETGSEVEALSGPSPRHEKPEKEKSNAVRGGFRSAKSVAIQATSSSEEEADGVLDKALPASSKATLGRTLPAEERILSSPPVPEPTFAISAPSRRKRAVLRSAPPSSPIRSREEAPRRLVRRDSPSLMPPPLVPQSQKREKKKPKLKMKDNPTLFDVEAAHSGDAVSEGDGSDVDMVESDSDHRFLGQLPETQVSPSYNQTAAYRIGLMTQAPEDANGPVFKTRKKVVGPFSGGRTQVPKSADWSSPVRTSEPDEYEMGSFVVQDDDSILYDQSSEP